MNLVLSHTRLAARQLMDVHLPCMFLEHEAVLDYMVLRNFMAKALAEG